MPDNRLHETIVSENTPGRPKIEFFCLLFQRETTLNTEKLYRQFISKKRAIWWRFQTSLYTHQQKS